nr:MAG TPA: hypothetical protein [Caudoviricetes sp.]
MSKDRNLISFNSHIVESVMEKVGDEYTKEQIEDVLFSSVSYIHCLLRYTDNVEVIIPYIGSMVCNLPQMKTRKRKLLNKIKYTGIMLKHEEKELECLDKKINDISYANQEKKIKKGDFKTNNISHYIKILRRGFRFENIQDIQQKIF